MCFFSICACDFMYAVVGGRAVGSQPRLSLSSSNVFHHWPPVEGFRVVLQPLLQLPAVLVCIVQGDVLRLQADRNW